MSSPIQDAAASPERPRPVTLLGDHPILRNVLIACLTIVAVGWAVQTVADGAGLVNAVLIPTAVAVLLAGLLMPLQVLLNHRLRLPRSLAALLTLLAALAVIALIFTVAGRQLVTGLADISDVLADQFAALQDWVIRNSPLGQEQFSEAISQIRAWLAANTDEFALGALGAGFTVANFLIAAVLCFVATFFFLSQGDRLFASLVGVLPARWRRRGYEASRRGWVTLSTYARTQIVIAGVDALGIGLGALAVGVPLVVPLTAITFVLCFIPFFGAIASGAVVVVVALTFQGFPAAVAMLVIVIAVQQIESNLLSPILLGKAVDVHPLAVLLSVTAGTYALGIVGGLFALPIVATVKSMVGYLVGRDPFPVLDAGGRALTTSPKQLVGDDEPVALPPRLGDATPGWLDRT